MDAAWAEIEILHFISLLLGGRAYFLEINFSDHVYSKSVLKKTTKVLEISMCYKAMISM
jgi:hypothetical protein